MGSAGVGELRVDKGAVFDDVRVGSDRRVRHGCNLILEIVCAHHDREKK